MSLPAMLSRIDTRRELQQSLWELLAEMERARLQGDDDQAWRLEWIALRLVGVQDSMQH